MIYQLHFIFEIMQSGFLSSEKFKQISHFCGDLQRFSLRKSIFKEKTLARGHGACKFVKVFSAKIFFFQTITYCASGHGALGYCRFTKTFSPKIIFKYFANVFSCERNWLDCIFFLITWRPTAYRLSLTLFQYNNYSKRLVFISLHRAASEYVCILTYVVKGIL